MNGQLILREWKEKKEISLFALAFLLIFIVASLILAEQGDLLDILTSSILLVFLPMTAVLLGAGAFGAEFRDGAWAYLFSRPVNKAVIWFSKFLALFAILVGTLFVYYLALSRVPGLRERIAALGAKAIPLWGACLLLSVSLFLIAFSFSFLSDKQFHVIFLSIFVFAGFVLALASAMAGVNYSQPHLAFLIPVVWGLAAVSIGASSLHSFCRTDFSQPRAKAAGFLKSLGLFLAMTAVVVMALIGLEGRFRRITHIGLETSGRNAYIYLSRGLYRFDSERDSLKRLDGAPWLSWGDGISAGGGKIVWSKFRLIKKNALPEEIQEHWIMDEDGRNKRFLFRPSEVESGPLSGHYRYNFLPSRDGRRVVFKSSLDDIWGEQTLWSVNSDGSGLRNHKLDIPNLAWANCDGWTADNRSIILTVVEKPLDNKSPRRRTWLCKFSLESGVWQKFGEDAWKNNFLGLSPKGDKFGTSSLAPGAQPPLLSGTLNAVVRPGILSAYDLDTLARTDLLRAPSISHAAWDPSGTKIAFLSDNETRLGVYSILEGKVVSETAVGPALKNYDNKSLTWAADGQKVALSDLDGSRYILKIFDENLKQDKIYPIPRGETLKTCPGVYGLGQKILVLVLDYQSNRLWVFDLAKEKWRKLF